MLLANRQGIPEPILDENGSPLAGSISEKIHVNLEVTHYLRQRFGQEKIYLMAHSGGSFFSIQAAARAPELPHAYIGMGQMTYQLKSETLAHKYMLQPFKANGNGELVQTFGMTPEQSRPHFEN